MRACGWWGGWGLLLYSSSSNKWMIAGNSQNFFLLCFLQVEHWHGFSITHRLSSVWSRWSVRADSTSCDHMFSRHHGPRTTATTANSNSQSAQDQRARINVGLAAQHPTDSSVWKVKWKILRSSCWLPLKKKLQLQKHSIAFALLTRATCEASTVYARRDKTMEHGPFAA